MLPDLLQNGLRIVFCGAAAGTKSAELQMYYAGRGNKFWRVLYEVGLTSVPLSPQQYAELLRYQIGLTDLIKLASGMDGQIDFKSDATEVLRKKIIQYRPNVLCFNGKRAGEEFLSRPVVFGLQPESIGNTRLFVAPSTSGAANGLWDIKWWRELESISGVGKSS